MKPLYLYGSIHRLPTREAALAVCDMRGYVFAIRYTDHGYSVYRCTKRELYIHQLPFIVQPNYEIIDTDDTE